MKRKTTKIKARIVGIPIQNYPWASSHEWTLPATAEAYDAMQLQMARAMSENTWPRVREYWLYDAKRALAAIGIKRPKDNQ